jgi:hypothetical protein
MKNFKYLVTRPGAGIVSRHNTFSAAEKSFRRQEVGARKQGGYSRDEIEVFDPQEGVYRRFLWDMVEG